MTTRTHCERVEKLYKQYLTNWKAEHNEGDPASYEEWYDNEYVCGYTTEHNRTGKNKRPAEFYTAMDTYDFDDKTMQAIADHTEKNMVTNFGANYDLTDDDINSAWWAEMEGVALDFGMNYYEDYDEEIIDGWG